MKKLLCVLAVALFALSTLSAGDALAWIVGRKVCIDGEIRFEAINPWGDVVYYPVPLGPCPGCPPQGGGEGEGGDGNSGDIPVFETLLDDAVVSDVHMEAEGLVGHVMGADHDGIAFDETIQLDDVYTSDPQGDGLITLGALYVQISDSTCP